MQFAENLFLVGNHQLDQYTNSSIMQNKFLVIKSEWSIPAIPRVSRYLLEIITISITDCFFCTNDIDVVDHIFFNYRYAKSI